MNNICLGLVAQSVKNPPAAQGLTSGLGRSSGEGNGNLLQYSCLRNLTKDSCFSSFLKNFSDLSFSFSCTEIPIRQILDSHFFLQIYHVSNFSFYCISMLHSTHFFSTIFQLANFLFICG